MSKKNNSAAEAETENLPSTAVATELPDSYVSRLNMKAMGINKDRVQTLVLADKAAQPTLALLYGNALKVRTCKKEGEDGESDRTWLEFTGNFQGQNLLTGEKYFSDRLTFPGKDLPDLIAAQVGASTLGCIFGFVISARYSDKAPTSYMYTYAPFTKTKSEAMSALEASIPAGLVKKGK